MLCSILFTPDILCNANEVAKGNVAIRADTEKGKRNPSRFVAKVLSLLPLYACSKIIFERWVIAG